jgi:hypothetical protein
MSFYGCITIGFHIGWGYLRRLTLQPDIQAIFTRYIASFNALTNSGIIRKMTDCSLLSTHVSPSAYNVWRSKKLCPYGCCHNHFVLALWPLICRSLPKGSAPRKKGMQLAVNRVGAINRVLIGLVLPEIDTPIALFSGTSNFMRNQTAGAVGTALQHHLVTVLLGHP